jgi:hypothetical protein
MAAEMREVSREVFTMLRLTVIVAVLALHVGVYAAEPITPEVAKEALLQMSRSKSGQNVGFCGDISDRFAKFMIIPTGEGWHGFSTFQFHPETAVYKFSAGNFESGACVFFYEGKFVEREGRWSATQPKETLIVRPAIGR